MTPHDKLFIPGPVEVSEKTWCRVFASDDWASRRRFLRIFTARFIQGFRHYLEQSSQCFLSTSSAWGVMEASVRNLVDRGVLCCMCGAFSDKWFDVAKRCGKEAAPLQVDWENISIKRRSTGNWPRENSTRSRSFTTRLHRRDESAPKICRTLAKYPDVALVLDTVLSFSGVKIDMDALGVDVMLTGAQKALALPPGFSLFSASEKAFARAEKIPNRGFYFDFLEFQKQQAEWMTPSTASIGHMHALQSKLDEIFDEGLEARFARHERTNAHRA